MSDPSATPPPLDTVPCSYYEARRDVPLVCDPEFTLRDAFVRLAIGDNLEQVGLPLIDLGELTWCLDRLETMVASLVNDPSLIDLKTLPLAEHLEKEVSRGASHQIPDVFFHFEKTVVAFAVRFEPFDWPSILANTGKELLEHYDADRFWVFALDPANRMQRDRNLDYNTVCDLVSANAARIEALEVQASASCDWCVHRFTCGESPFYSRRANSLASVFSPKR